MVKGHDRRDLRYRKKLDIGINKTFLKAESNWCQIDLQVKGEWNWCYGETQGSFGGKVSWV